MPSKIFRKEGWTFFEELRMTFVTFANMSNFELVYHEICVASEGTTSSETLTCFEFFAV